VKTTDELRKLKAAITPGPWKADATQPDDVVVWGQPKDGDDRLVCNVGHQEISRVGVAFDVHAADGALIALAPKLLDEVLTMRGEENALEILGKAVATLLPDFRASGNVVEHATKIAAELVARFGPEACSEDDSAFIAWADAQDDPKGTSGWGPWFDGAMFAARRIRARVRTARGLK
jgi:hypothetical protein